MDYFKLTRAFWDYAFENPEKIKPNHCALYLFIIEHCNRLGWKKKFGLPTTMVKDAIGIRSYNTYIQTLNDLVEFGLIDLIEKSKNQYSSNIIAISNFDKALDKALDNALTTHCIKQDESTVQSTDSINKHTNNIYYSFAHLSITNEQFEKLKEDYKEEDIIDVFEKIENYKQNAKYKSLYLTAKAWLKKDYSESSETLPEHLNIDFPALIGIFNRRFRKSNLIDLPQATKKRFLELLKCGYTKEDISKAIERAYTDELNRDRISLEMFSFASNIDKYKNFQQERL